MPDTSPAQKEQKATMPVPGGTWSPFDTLRNEIDRLFDDFGPSPWRPLSRQLLARTQPTAPDWVLSPAVDVVEKDDAFEITVEIPGLDEKNIDIRLASGILTIRGEKTEEREEKEKTYHVSERHYGLFQRSFRLPDYVDADKVSAAFAKGILKVTIPKASNAGTNDRKIEIKAG
ncbi:molecular chaperone Hsp20 [Rhizobium sp. R72]|uniref:Hsp20/alpha crystallin family protein n=1 Tax=unclassified Rhizobium TaxID=2613769 RepID=UPI000B535736|nr:MULTISPECIES: Hsp20/alpha crystallin family protein [unclassified Rhizobium]OWW05412.1 molecular chaperone Hsp20 [Rhizobium sp. R72]OWW06469.1 molecular chaperone Hsp20 [Rhizobium sp. R711]